MLQSIKKCVADAEEATSDIVMPELRVAAFKIVLSKLLDVSVGIGPNLPHTGGTVVHDAARSGSEDKHDGLPVISPTDGLANNVRALFATEWGSKRHAVREINMALEENGLSDPKHISTVLTRLVESRELLRKKEGDAFVYWTNPAGGASKGQV